MELRQLRYFVVIAQELNFNRAAEILRVAQPALSQQMRQLEDEMQVTLFDRRRRQIRLTVAGKTFLEDAQKVLNGVETSLRMAQRAARGELGRLVIGFTPIASWLLPATIRAYLTRYPEIELGLEELLSGEQVQALRADLIDLSFILGQPNGDEELLSWEIVSSHPSVLALPAQHPLAAMDGTVRWTDLADQPLVIMPRRLQPQLYDQFISRCRAAGYSPRIIQEVAQLESILNMVAAGIGVAPVAANQAEAVNWQGVVYRPLEEPTPRFEICAVWRSDDDSPALHSFLATLRRAIT